MLLDNSIHSDAREARDIIMRYGSSYVTKDGWTLLHRAATTSRGQIYVMAKHGLAINSQNSAGDTPLHIAVRAGNYQTCEALLQCSADVTIRNKMAQTPLDMAEGHVCELLENFQPGPVGALLAGRTNALARILPTYWCNLNSIVKDGMSLLDLAQTKAGRSEALSKSFRVIKEFKPTAELIHAVLSEDVEHLKTILSSKQRHLVNIRFMGKNGRTLLDYGIEANNLEVIKLLVNSGAKVNTRVRQNGWSHQTIPLLHRALRQNIDPNIPKYLLSVLEVSELMERDQNGNTALLRAVEERADMRLIEWLLEAVNGKNLTQRNIKGMNARELAAATGQDDLVQYFEKYIFQQEDTNFFLHLTVSYYGQENLKFIEEEGTTKLELSQSGKKSEAIEFIQHYSVIEEKGNKLFKAAATGELTVVKKLNSANFQDQNGYTALIRSIVFNQLEIARYLIDSRPALKSMPDNHSRYPLHYAYALPEAQGQDFIGLLLEKRPEEIEKKTDKDGLFPVDYRVLRGTTTIRQLLHQAQTLDSYCKEGPPLASIPEGQLLLALA